MCGLPAHMHIPKPISNMEIPRCLVLLWCLSALLHVQSQEGFLTLRCGMPENFTSTDPATKMILRSDFAFINGGESMTDAKPASLRRFPRGRRNCYNLNVTRDAQYLVRAIFVYGNYDNLNEKPIFDLHIGPNKWDTVDFEGMPSVNVPVTKEIIHVPRSDNLQVCLVRTGTTTPFITTLELRQLSNDVVYNIESPNASLVTVRRSYFRDLRSVMPTRFPDDIYDRLWDGVSGPSSDLRNTTLSVDTSDIFRPPEPVMQTAATLQNAPVPFGFQWRLLRPQAEMHMYMYFAEVEELKPGEIREFDIKLNGVHYYGPMRPKKLRAETVHVMLSEKYCKDQTCVVTLARTSRSTHVPIINAQELYNVAEFLQSETDHNDVETMMRIKEIYGLNRTSWEGDPCAPLELMWDGLNCTSEVPPSITSLNLSSSGLTGTISPWIQNLTRLEELDLSNNDLTGGVPEFLASMRSLYVIYLSHNRLSGSVPESVLDRARNGSLTLFVQGNLNIYCPKDACKDQDLKNKAKARRIITSVVVASVASAFAILVTLAVFLIHRKRSLTRKDAQSTAGVFQLQCRFIRSDVQTMTNNFENVLGRGRLGVLYNGCMNETERVVVEVLADPTALDLEKFKHEVELLLRVHHKNLLDLVGYSDEGDILALIYEHLANGDLKTRLSEQHEDETLSLASRLSIAIQAAEGLLYLHRGCDPPMVHGDVNTSNILLGENLQAKIANFGLPRSFETESETLTSSSVAGTPGYVDPEYQKTRWLTDKSDVYSFGVVLLEILTNQPVIDENREGEHISEWIQQMLAKKADITAIADPRLKGKYRSGSVWKALETAMACVEPSCNNRPSMLHVVAQLKECLVAETSTGRERQGFKPNSGAVSTSLTMPR